MSISTPDHGQLDFELAGIGSRFSAHVVDLLLIILVVVLLILGLSLANLTDVFAWEEASDDFSSWTTSWGAAILIFMIFVVAWGYFVFFETFMRGSTPGKREFGIRVMRDDGLPIGFREAALRNLLRAADVFPPPSYLLALITIMLDGYGRRLGDIVAGTVVVRERFEETLSSSAGAAWAARVERGQSRAAITLAEGALSPAQLDLIEQFLGRRFELAPERRAALAWQIARPLLHLQNEDPDLWKDRPNRTEECERVLLHFTELAKSRPATAPRDQPIAPRPPLF